MPGSQPVAGLRHLLWRMAQRWAGSGGAGRAARSGARRSRPPGQRLSCPSGRVPSGLCRWCRPAAAFARVVAGRAAARRMAARRRAGCGAVKALREWRGRPTSALRPVRPRRRPLPRGFAATGALPRHCFFGNMLQTVLPLLQIGQRTKKNRKYSGRGALSYAKIYYLC